MDSRSDRFEYAQKLLKKSGNSAHSLIKIAALVGMGKQHLSLWKLGKISKCVHDEKIAETMGVSLEWLRDGVGNGPVVAASLPEPSAVVKVCETTMDDLMEVIKSLSKKIDILREEVRALRSYDDTGRSLSETERLLSRG